MREAEQTDYMNVYVDSIIAEHKAQQENDALLKLVQTMAAELRVVRDALSEIRQQNTELTERMDYLESVSFIGETDDSPEKPPQKIPVPEPTGHDPPQIHMKSKGTLITSGILIFFCMALFMVSVATFAQRESTTKPQTPSLTTRSWWQAR